MSVKKGLALGVHCWKNSPWCTNTGVQVDPSKVRRRRSIFMHSVLCSRVRTVWRVWSKLLMSARKWHKSSMQI